MSRFTSIYKIAGLAACALIIVGALFLLSRMRSNVATDSTIKIVAAQNFWGNIAAQIGGEHVTVTSVISDAEADPHLYESGVKDASAITDANIVIVSGLGYDGFMDKLLEASPRSDRVVIKASTALEAQAIDNPHTWYNIARVGIVAEVLQQKLTAMDPAHSTDYRANLKKFTESLSPLLATAQKIRTTYPGAPVAYTERVPGYLLSLAGLSVQSPESFAAAIESGNEPSPADQAAMLALIAHKQIRVLLYNAQADSPVTESIRAAATKNHIPVVAVTETIPQGIDTYQAWQQTQLDELLKALENTK